MTILLQDIIKTMIFFFFFLATKMLFSVNFLIFRLVLNFHDFSVLQKICHSSISLKINRPIGKPCNLGAKLDCVLGK